MEQQQTENLKVDNVDPVAGGGGDGVEDPMPKYLFLIATALHIIGVVAEVHFITVFLSAGCHIYGYVKYMNHPNENTKKWARFNIYGVFLSIGVFASYIIVIFGSVFAVFFVQIGVMICMVPYVIVCLPCFMVASLFPPLMIILILPLLLILVPVALIPAVPLLLALGGLAVYSGMGGIMFLKEAQGGE